MHVQCLAVLFIFVLAFVVAKYCHGDGELNHRVVSSLLARSATSACLRLLLRLCVFVSCEYRCGEC